jgi:hypothetical protein
MNARRVKSNKRIIEGRLFNKEISTGSKRVKNAKIKRIKIKNCRLAKIMSPHILKRFPRN